MNPLRVALIGIGGFGKVHTQMIVDLAGEGILTCAAFCDPSADRFAEQKAMLESIGAKPYSDYQEMITQHELDFVVIATPIPLHKKMSIYAMEQGIPIFLEKPPAVAIEDLDEMLEVQKRTGVLAAVNFLNTSGRAFRLMLDYIREGRIGDIQSIVAVGQWKRTQAYYDRTYWAGSLVYNGDYVLDGPICNALSHLLNNALLIAGNGDARQAEPVWVQAELYKGHDIESEDTNSIRVATQNGHLVHFYSTLCGDDNSTTYIKVKGSTGEMVWWYADNKLTYTDHTGQEHVSAFEKESLMRNMYVNMIDALQGKGTRLFSSLADSRSFVLAANGAFTSSDIIHKIPREAMDIHPENDTVVTIIKDIHGIFEQASIQCKLLSENSVSWAKATPKVDMTNYRKLQLGTKGLSS